MEHSSKLLGLYLPNLKNSNEKICKAVSLDKNILQNMFDLIDKKYLDKSKIVVRSIKFYSVTKIINNTIPIKLYGINNDLLFIRISEFRKEFY